MNKTPWYTVVTNEAKKSADLLIYDEIGGFFGVDAQELVRDLSGLDVDDLQVYVNSPGGDVFAGVAIMNALRRHKARVTAHVDGLAGSAASFLIQAADEIVMGRGSELMIHDASALCMGNAKDMQDTAEVLDQISMTIAELYADRAGETAEFWRDAMRAETWYNAGEAVEAGLADRVEEPRKRAGTKNVHDLSVFNHAGRDNAPAPPMPHHPGATHLPSQAPAFDRLVALAGAATTAPPNPAPPAPSVDDHAERTDDMSEKLIKGVRARLGVPAEAKLDEDGILAALDEALAEGGNDTAANAGPTVPEGTVLLDSEEHQRLLAEAEKGRKADEATAKAHREAIVEAALKDGRIPAARKDHWLAQLEADPGAEQVLGSLAKGTVPVQASGFTGGVDESPDDVAADDLYSKLYPKTKEA
ncbi:head maturation protease, ClpP-related [Brevibacterium sp.]|uniref:head maturation protease, ClpP-related n=1 Tax=Brevibacterium sp. TaxID=1701 RepID=UPI0028126B24|nr:head maturation protease, ClpP-related [Brevibacterium sp.]